MKKLCLWIGIGSLTALFAGCGLIKSVQATAERMPEMIEASKVAIGSIKGIVEMLKDFIQQVMDMFKVMREATGVVTSTFTGSEAGDGAAAGGAGLGLLALLWRNFQSGKMKGEMNGRIGKLEAKNGGA